MSKMTGIGDIKNYLNYLCIDGCDEASVDRARFTIILLLLWSTRPHSQTQILPSWKVKKLPRCTSHKASFEYILMHNHQFGTTSAY
jgi:hypothetical protein